MVFHPPTWVPQLPIDPPDSVTIEQFITSEAFGRYPIAKSRNPFTCGLTGKTYSWAEVSQRANFLARAIGNRLGWHATKGTPWEKVIAVFSLNSIDYLTVLYAAHRFSGITTPANAAYSAPELQYQLTSSSAQAIFTCAALLETTLKATRTGIPNDKVFLLDVPVATEAAKQAAAEYTTIDQLISEGSKLPPVEDVQWTKGQGAWQPAFFCYSSGTAGIPKSVMISHYKVISNILQMSTFESVGRKLGDEVIVLPKFELKTFLAAIQKYRIQQLCVVPPIIIRLLRAQDICSKYDLSSVRFLFTGVAPTGEETLNALRKIYPKWIFGQGYGMTETSCVVSSTSEHDTFDGSSGSLIPGVKVKIMGNNGTEVTKYDTPGELLVQAPSVVLGYLNNEKANRETFIYHDDGRWIRTGDEVIITLTPSGNEHLVIIDRIKELIKVNGHQVAPAELEAHLLTHPAVADTAVIQIPDDNAGEVPKAFVVCSAAYASKLEAEVAREIAKHSPSGKILRRLLRDQEKAKERQAGFKFAALFFIDFLIERDGKLITGPSSSAENSYYLLGTDTVAFVAARPAWDGQILTELFRAVVEAGRLFEKDVTEYNRVFAKLPTPQIGKHGQVIE
ncbi:hypothetical protein SEUCBS139899_009851 [Sporothrix eucalyptigena]|uniref:AMP-dependent synthetase/ligase domain-containing protein n=1 Tax=Sporothrix eucalyptigena TaxID=1812306 RepID=A0ABP0CYN0_9PEZI